MLSRWQWVASTLHPKHPCTRALVEEDNSADDNGQDSTRSKRYGAPSASSIRTVIF